MWLGCGIELTKNFGTNFRTWSFSFSRRTNDRVCGRAMLAGAMGYVVKNEGIDALRTGAANALIGKRTFSLLEKWGHIGLNG